MKTEDGIRISTIVASATETSADLGAGDIVGLILISVLVFVLLPYLVVMLRKFLKLYEKEIQFQQRKHEHMDTTERHMAEAEKKLDEIIEQLKRRPLS